MLRIKISPQMPSYSQIGNPVVSLNFADRHGVSTPAFVASAKKTRAVSAKDGASHGNMRDRKAENRGTACRNFSRFIAQNLTNYADDICGVKSFDCEVRFRQLLLVRAQQRENRPG